MMQDVQPEMPVPDWSNAPKWASYWTRDISGIAMWWETKPALDKETGLWLCEDDSLRARGTDLTVLYERPVTQSKQEEK